MKTASHYIASFLKKADGVAAVEFALIAPILILMVVGIYDFGMYMNTTMRMESSARAVAEYIFQGGDEDNIEADVIMGGSLNLSETDRQNLNVETEFICECNEGASISCDSYCGAGDYRRRYLEVNMSMGHRTLIPYPGLPNPMSVNGSVRLQVE